VKLDLRAQLYSGKNVKVFVPATHEHLQVLVTVRNENNTAKSIEEPILCQEHRCWQRLGFREQREKSTCCELEAPGRCN